MSADDPVAAAPGFTEHVAQVATERAAAWAAFAEVLGPPALATVERVRSGELTETWRAGTRWLGADVEMVTAALMSLDVYARGAARRSVAQDLAAWETDHAELVAKVTGVGAALRELAELCRAEAAEWSAGRMAAGKERRAQQHALLTGRLTPVLPDLGATLVREARSNVWRTLGRLLLAFLSAESGRDYQRAVLGETRPRRS